VKMDGFHLPSPSRRRRQQRAAQFTGGGAVATGRAFIGDVEGAANRALHNLFGTSSKGSPSLRPPALRAISQADTLELCEKVLAALLDVAMLHEVNEWLQQQLSWRTTAAKASSPASSARVGESSPATTAAPPTGGAGASASLQIQIRGNVCSREVSFDDPSMRI
jgi:hypothetical protein